MKKILFNLIVAGTVLFMLNSFSPTSKNYNDIESELSLAAFNIDPIITEYLVIKNALAADDTKSAAVGGQTFVEKMNKVDLKSLSTNKIETFKTLSGSAVINAEAIKNNAGNLKVQRAHFLKLSNQVEGLIDEFGTKMKLYREVCPMYDNNKGGNWISEYKDIRNPYFGAQMYSCGYVDKEYK